MKLAIFKIHIKKKVELCYGISWILETPTQRLDWASVAFSPGSSESTEGPLAPLPLHISP